MRIAVVVVVAAALVLSACGSSASHSSSDATVKPTPTATASMRNLADGETVTLKSGLTLTVPKTYRGWYFQDPSGAHGSFDVIASHDLAQKGLRASFMARSETAQGEKAGPFHWPLLASSSDPAVELRCVGLRLGTDKAREEIALISRLPDRPTGLVLMSVFGADATTDPSRVIAQVRSMWTLFSIQSVPIPDAD